MGALELVVVLGVAVLACGALARRLRAAPAVPLIVTGVVLGFVPTLREVQLPPDAVLLIFLPVLLFWESLTTSLREIRANLRVIVLMSTLLVVVTAAAVAVAAHALGLGWGASWVLGAALAPTDATAVGALTRALPRRTVTTLRAESLVNDGTALVVYGLAVGVTVGADHLGTWHVAGLFAGSYLGGALAGAATGAVATVVHHRLDDPVLYGLTLVVTPFVAFLAAEAMSASGVLAVVVCGLVLSQTGPRVGHPDGRQQSAAVFRLATYVLNGALFLLIGIEAQSAVRDLTSVNLARGVWLVLAVSAVVIGTRFVWLFTTPYVIRALDRRPQQRLRRVGARQRLVSGATGFRGAVSLAAALAVPVSLDSGAPFPHRDLIVFVTAGVILVTTAQALVLPRLVRLAHFPPDTGVEDERRLAQRTASESAYAALPRLADELGVEPDVVDRVRREYEEHLRTLTDDGDDDERTARWRRQEDGYTALRLAAIAHKRATVVHLRDQQRIDDTVLRQLQSHLDIEEIRLRRPEPIE